MTMIAMSDLQPDLGRRWGGGGGRRWGGGGGWRRPSVNYYYSGGYPYYYDPMIPTPIYEIDPVGPPDTAAAEAAKVKAIAEAVKAELAKDKSTPAMGQGLELPPVQSFYIDVMGPGARDADIDRVARDDELVDEAIPAQQALAIRKAMGLSGMGDLSSALAPENRMETIKTVGIVLGGAVGGYFVADWLIKRMAS